MQVRNAFSICELLENLYFKFSMIMCYCFRDNLFYYTSNKKMYYGTFLIAVILKLWKTQKIGITKNIKSCGAAHAPNQKKTASTYTISHAHELVLCEMGFTKYCLVTVIAFRWYM